MTIEQQLKKLISDCVNIDPAQIKLTDHLVTDLNMDSLNLVEIVMNIEDEFRIHIEPYEADVASTVSLIIELIKSKTKKEELEQ
jgi:acyl carrier protein